MRVLLLCGLTASLGLHAASTARAQDELTAAAIDQDHRLPGAQRIRYLLRQIDLTADQAQYAESLIAAALPAGGAGPAPGANVNDVRLLWEKLERARKAGDQQKVEQLTRELADLGQDAAGDSDVFVALAPRLTDEQKAALEQARARLEREPSGAVRPIDLIRAARRQNLTPEQQARLREATVATNKMLGPLLKPKVELKLRMVNFLAGEIRALLTPEQVAVFDRQVRTLRPDRIDDGLVVEMPAAASTP